MSFLVLAIVVLLAILWFFLEPSRTAWRRRRLRRQPFPPAWREILRQRVPYFRRLPADLQLQLKGHIQVFLAEKDFVGCDGLVVSEEMRVTVAAQACLLILNRRAHYFPGLRQILLYPAPFIVRREQADGFGLVSERERVLSGESWAHGQVVLSWPDVLAGAAASDDGRNVVIHEFAHQLDQEKGHANGAPGLIPGEGRRRWSRVFGREYRRLREQTAMGEPSLFDAYGATEPAEFFAVASEVFFEQAPRLAAGHPALYRELSRLYRVDPLSW